MGVTGDDYSGPRSPACTLSRKTGDRISLRSYVRILTSPRPEAPRGARRGAPPSAPSSVFQALGTITAVPVTGPQVSSLQRLAGQGAAVLPQVSGPRAGPGPCVRLSVCPSPRSVPPAPQHRGCGGSSALGQVGRPLASWTACPGPVLPPLGFSRLRARGTRPRTPLCTPACAHTRTRTCTRREPSPLAPGTSAGPGILFPALLLPGF